MDPKGRKEKILKVGNTTIRVQQLNLDELIEVSRIAEKPLDAMKVALSYGIVEPKELRENPGQMNIEVCTLLMTEIVGLSTLPGVPNLFNPSKRNKP